MAAHQRLRPGPRKYKAGAGGSGRGFGADNFGPPVMATNTTKQDFGVFSFFVFLVFTNLFFSIYYMTALWAQKRCAQPQTTRAAVIHMARSSNAHGRKQHARWQRQHARPQTTRTAHSSNLHGSGETHGWCFLFSFSFFH